MSKHKQFFFKHAKTSHRVRKVDSVFSGHCSRTHSHKKITCFNDSLASSTKMPCGKREQNNKNSLRKDILLNMYDLISLRNKHSKQSIWETQY